MAIAHSTSKARPGRNRSPKIRGKAQRPAKRSKKLAQGRKTSATSGSGTPEGLGPQIANGSRIRVRGRLKDVLHAEWFNLGKAESLLRCLWLAMEFVDLGTEGVAYFPNVVEVAGDLVRRSKMDLENLHDGRIPDPLMAALKVEH
jgi:hypothetical protein